MNEFLSKVILNNPVKQYLIVFAIIWVVYIFKKYLSRFIADVSFGFFSKKNTHIRKEPFKNLVAGPVQLFLMIVVVFITLNTLNFPKEFDFKIHKVPVADIIDSVGATIVILAFTWLLLRIIDFITLVMQEKASLTPDQSDDQLVVFFKDFLKIIIVFIGILLIIHFSFHKEIGPLLTGLSIFGAALALAARESLENIIASFIIFFDKPFTLGDLVKVQTITGNVEKIGLRSTRLRTDQKTYVTIPNKQMVDNILDNLTLRTLRKGELRLELDPATNPAAVKKFIETIQELIRENYSVGINSFSIYLTDLTRNGIVIAIDYFTATVSMDIFNQLRHRLNFDVLRLMEEQGIKLTPVKS
jgi:MscS family membrane protein